MFNGTFVGKTNRKYVSQICQSTVCQPVGCSVLSSSLQLIRIKEILLLCSYEILRGLYVGYAGYIKRASKNRIYNSNKMFNSLVVIVH